jgi:hypothetical protein
VNLVRMRCRCARHNELSPLPRGGEHVKESLKIIPRIHCSRQRSMDETTLSLLRGH